MGGGKIALAYYHGRMYGKDKETILSAADIFVFSTFYHNECFPLVLLEAMQHGLPCVSTAEGGIPGIIDEGETGYLTEKHDCQALADKIEYLCLHAEARRSMGDKGRRKFLREFTLGRFEGRMSEILWGAHG